MDIASEYFDEDADGMLLLIGSEDDGRVYISVQDRKPVVLTPDQAEEAGRQLASPPTSATTSSALTCSPRQDDMPGSGDIAHRSA